RRGRAEADGLEDLVHVAAREGLRVLELGAQGLCALAAPGQARAPAQKLVRARAPAVVPAVVRRVEALREVGVVNVVLRLRLSGCVHELPERKGRGAHL